MRMFFAPLFLTLFSFNALHSMELFKAAFHKVDKNYIAPAYYVSGERTKILSEELLKLNPTNPTYAPFILDDALKQKMHEAFEREEKLIGIVRYAIRHSLSHAEIEQITGSIKNGYYSPLTYAMIFGFLSYKLKKAETDAVQLQKYHNTEGKIEKKALGLTLDNPQNMQAALDSSLLIERLTPSALDELIIQKNTTYLSQSTNALRKTLWPLEYLTEDKCRIVAQEILRFLPHHPHPEEFNPHERMHRRLVKNACDRNIGLLQQVEKAIDRNDYQTILTINERAHKAYISDILQAVIAGYLNFASEQNKKEIDGRGQKIPYIPNPSQERPKENSKENEQEKQKEKEEKPLEIDPQKQIEQGKKSKEKEAPNLPPKAEPKKKSPTVDKPAPQQQP